jgi:hypothetical protein
MTSLRNIAASLALGAFVSLPPPAAAEDFPDVVSEILNRQVEGPISVMSEKTKEAMVTCVNTVLEALPKGKKRFILAGEDYEERESRFGKVLYQNRAEWVQKIARGCASIALSGG